MTPEYIPNFAIFTIFLAVGGDVHPVVDKGDLLLSRPLHEEVGRVG
ncbi:hypothetical protein ACFFWE_21935 [Sphaerisporangium melleum]|nr:hypothetical protein [Sphaerisporangium melleum]